MCNILLCSAQTAASTDQQNNITITEGAILYIGNDDVITHNLGDRVILQKDQLKTEISPKIVAQKNVIQNKKQPITAAIEKKIKKVYTAKKQERIYYKHNKSGEYFLLYKQQKFCSCLTTNYSQWAVLQNIDCITQMSNIYFKNIFYSDFQNRYVTFPKKHHCRPPPFFG